MTSLILVPLDDSVVFPTMDVTLPVDVGDEERVLLVPRHDDAFATVGTIADGRRAASACPAAARAVQLSGIARGIAGAAQTDPTAACASRSTEHPDDVPVDGRTRDLEREYRAVVEEILELRGDDGRVARLRALDHRARPAGRHRRLLPRPRPSSRRSSCSRRSTSPSASRSPLELQRERLTELQVRRKHPRRRPVGRREAAARVLPAQADGVDPQGARRGRRARVVEEYRTQDRRGRHAGRGRASRPSASSAGSSAWASSRARRR